MNMSKTSAPWVKVKKKKKHGSEGTRQSKVDGTVLSLYIYIFLANTESSSVNDDIDNFG